MPFAYGVIPVAGWAQHFRDRHALAVQFPTVTVSSLILHHVPDSGLVWMQSRQQRSACGATSRCVIELSKLQPVRAQRIEVGRLDFAAVTADIRKPNVIGEDNDNIRRCCGCLGLRNRQRLPSQDGANHEEARNSRHTHNPTGQVHLAGFRVLSESDPRKAEIAVVSGSVSAFPSCMWAICFAAACRSAVLPS